jgi:hypothetical protein
MASVVNWWDDPILDSEQEVFCGKLFRAGVEWRRLQEMREYDEAKEVFSVAGTTFHRDAVETAQGKTNVAIVPEPENKFDPAALRVEVGGAHVGYIPRGKKLSPDDKLRVIKSGMDPTPFVWLAVGA